MTPPCVGSLRQAFGSSIESRPRCIREREATKSSPSKLCSQRPGLRKDPGLFHFGINRPVPRRRPAIEGSRHRQRWLLFNSLRRDDLGTGRGFVLQLCGCSSVGRARPCQGRGHEFETRHPLHFGCVHALRCRATWCWRCGMCATPGQFTCSETPHPTGCSRLGTAAVDSSPS